MVDKFVDQSILQKYARVLVNFALGGGKGIKKGEVVYVGFDETAKPLALEVLKAILKSGGHPIMRMGSDDFEKTFLELASKEQLEFFPKKYYKALIDTIDHRIALLSHKDPLYLRNIDPKKISLMNKKSQILKRWFFAKEDQGKFTWTLALYGTKKQADQAGLTLKEYWEQIIKACFLDYQDPIKKWREVFRKIETLKKKINSMGIKTLHFKGKDTDLKVGLGEKRIFAGGGGRNIPSFEIFTSPDWRLVEGKVYFDLPLYRYGNIIKGIYLEFKDGRVVKARAKKNEKLLKELVKQKNADKVGEVSLTDRRFSRIDRFMAHTLYDENFGGKWGNMHLALGSSYHDCYDGDAKKLKAKDWKKLGFNESPEHTDIIQTQDRRVEVELKNGVKRVLYEGGEFRI